MKIKQPVVKWQALCVLRVEFGGWQCKCAGCASCRV